MKELNNKKEDDKQLELDFKEKESIFDLFPDLRNWINDASSTDGFYHYYNYTPYIISSEGTIGE